MVFTCWVGRPESAQGSGCLSTPPQTALSCTKPLSESSSRKNKLTTKISSWVFGACICSLFGLYSLQLSAIRKMLQQVAGHSRHWRALPGPHSCVQGSRPLAHWSSALSSLCWPWEEQNFCDCLEDFSLHFCCVQGFTCQMVGCWVTGILLSCTKSKTICCF